LVLDDHDADPERIEEDLRSLLDDVAELDGVEVDRVDTGPLPPGVRSGGAVEVGAALIALGGGGAVLPMLVGLLRDWLGRRSSGSIRLKIGSDEVEMDQVPTEVQREVLRDFLDRHRD
jgi:hypothetical protein